MEEWDQRLESLGTPMAEEGWESQRHGLSPPADDES